MLNDQINIKAINKEKVKPYFSVFCLYDICIFTKFDSSKTERKQKVKFNY